MENASKFIQALSSLLWPIIGLILLWRFRDAIAQVIESAKGRKFTVKVGGQELTMEEANTQQEKSINDLRNQITTIQQILNISANDLANHMSLSSENELTLNSVLWVDDNPKNNSYLISAINDNGYEVDLALSTADALKLIAKNRYRVIISDMGRGEIGSYEPEAGLSLLRKLRESNDQTPFVVFCSPLSARKYKEAVIASGGISATSSSSVLFSLIKEFIPPREA